MTTGLDPALDYHIVNSLGWPDLRPLQRDSVAPILNGDDCLLLAPTAGGKTEAAAFPLLTKMHQEQWRGLSVLYVTPLRALLNNLEPRLDGYANWLGRRAGLWHGDVGQGDRKRLMADMPDILLTTPESLEAMLVSTKVEHRSLFSGVKAVVVDELHAFAGDDRGWHLLAVLERLQVIAGHRIQRIGLSATVGNPAELLSWMQGGTAASCATVVNPSASSGVTAGPSSDAEVTLDYVGSVSNAATVVSRLHVGEKRLVFCESRAQAELMAAGLRERGTQTFVSHSSLSRDERRQSESAFAETRDCVVVATSTLELGIDVGDLDRVIQLDAPGTVASFLQRLGRTGRRPGSIRNTLFLVTKEESLLQAAGLLRLWKQGFVEPVVPPPHPRHIVAQQLLALALQEGALGLATWQRWWPSLSMMVDGPEILEYLISEGFLAVDGAHAFVGDAAERHFGRRNFMDLTAVFTAPPELKILFGRKEIGSVSPLALTARTEPGAPLLLLLAGRAWLVTNVDWRGRRVSVTESGGGGRARWSGSGGGLSQQMTSSMRDVLLGLDPDVEMSNRAMSQLALTRAELQSIVDPDGMVLRHSKDGSILWTFAGYRANRSLAAALDEVGLETTADSLMVSTKQRLGVDELRACALPLSSSTPPAPTISQDVLDGLKFSVSLPHELACDTLVERMTDATTAAAVARGRVAVVDVG